MGNRPATFPEGRPIATQPSHPPTIAHVLHRLHVAGAEVLAADMSRRLRDRYRFAFFCLDGVGPLGETLRGEGFDVVDLGRKPGIDLAVARRMRQQVQRLGVSLLHAHQYTPFFYASLARGAMPWRASPPLLFTEHGRHYPDARKPRRVLANRFLLRRRDRVTAVGAFVKQALVANEGLAADRVTVVYNGIDPQRFALDESGRERAAARAELGLADHQPALLQVARFHPVKDHATALRAFAIVVREVPEAVLLLAGDGELREKSEALAGELGLNRHVRFLGVRQDVPRLMMAADVFLLSSLSEGISVTLLEAMGCRVPIAATDVGGNREVVEHGVTGLLSPRGEPRKLAENLLTLLRDEPLRRRMGDAGRARLLERFTQEAMHGRYAAIYEQMVGR